MVRKSASRLIRQGRWIVLGLVLLVALSATTLYVLRVRRDKRYDQLIQEIAAKHQVDHYLIKAVIRRESKFNQAIRGRAGEYGLMQVTDLAGLDWAMATGQDDFDEERLWDPRTNIEAGTWYLARALRRWRKMDDPVPFALAEYNAGLSNVKRWLPRGQDSTASEFIEAITYPGVRKYIRTVTEYHRRYRARGER